MAQAKQLSYNSKRLDGRGVVVRRIKRIALFLIVSLALVVGGLYYKNIYSKAPAPVEFQNKNNAPPLPAEFTQ